MPEVEWNSFVAEIWSIILLGGPVVGILIVMSIAATAIVIVKLWQFRACRALRFGNVRKAVVLKRQDRLLEALACVQGDRNPVARTFTLAMRGKIGDAAPESEIREEVQRFGNKQVMSLRSYLRPLEVIASLAPLLGLFGTVLGMISAFQQMEAAGSRVDPSVLSGGIWEALLTTAVGLAVAIPSVAALNWLERMVERVEAEMSDALAYVFTRDLTQSANQNAEARGRFPERIGAE